MARKKVVITHWVHNEVVTTLAETCAVIPNQTRTTLPRAEIIQRSTDASAIMVFMPDRIDSEFLENCPRLQVIAAALKGYDNIDLDACRRRGITFSYLPDLLTEPTAELAVALLLAVGRNILNGDRMVRQGEFKGWRPVLYGSGLWGSSVGIVGLGAIGRAIARRLRGFGCQTGYHDPARLDEVQERSLEVEWFPFDALLHRSRFLLVAVPLTPETLHLFDMQALAMMPQGAYLINVGRGSVVDEAAVAASLHQGHLAGYAADVFEFEDLARNDRPMDINPLLLGKESATVFTPHLGSATEKARQEIALAAARNILAAL